MKQKPAVKGQIPGTIDIEYIAKLANLSLTPQEKKTFEKQISQILAYISKLQEVDTSKVQPIGHITGLTNVVRGDQTAPSLTVEEALTNASKIDGDFFEVEAIFEEQ